MLTIALSIFAVASSFIAFLLALKRDLMMLQQNSYRPERYKRWLAESGDSTSYIRLIAWIAFFCAMLPAVSNLMAAIIIAVFGIIAIVNYATITYKKPLVFTKRAIRIYATGLIATFALYVLVFFAFSSRSLEIALRDAAVLYTGLLACSYAVAMISVWLLNPIEKRINKKYWREASNMLKSMPNLKIVGVTGSYGKTSTKHYLERMLSEQYETLMTPGNFNTTLGVVRTIRENLKPYHEVFIVEMGAKQLGDIKEICELVHPQIGVITAVGPMHLETFGSIENVQKTKFELADSLPKDGLAVINNDFEQIANRKVENAKCMRYAASDKQGADYFARDIIYDESGTTFTICSPDGDELTLHTPLVGSCNVSNLMAAAIVALKLGVKPDKIRYAAEKMEQVEHRLNLKRVPGGVNVIDDAYNSNPMGAKMALEVLQAIPNGTKFIITPGMVELGDDQYDLNVEFGKEIAKHADIAIIVGEYNKDALLEGLKKGNMPVESIRTADTFLEANALMLTMAKPGDTVLLENDLPDTFK